MAKQCNMGHMHEEMMHEKAEKKVAKKKHKKGK